MSTGRVTFGTANDAHGVTHERLASAVRQLVCTGANLRGADRAGRGRVVGRFRHFRFAHAAKVHLPRACANGEKAKKSGENDASERSRQRMTRAALLCKSVMRSTFSERNSLTIKEVLTRGLEPPRVSPYDSESYASAISPHEHESAVSSGRDDSQRRCAKATGFFRLKTGSRQPTRIGMST